MTPRNPGTHFWVRSPKPSEDVWPHDWDVMWWDGEYFWGTNGDGYKADSLVVGPRASSPEEQAASLISAAPEMFEALQRLRGWIEHWSEDVDFGLKPTRDSLARAVAIVDEALSKAEAEA